MATDWRAHFQAEEAEGDKWEKRKGERLARPCNESTLHLVLHLPANVTATVTATAAAAPAAAAATRLQ